MLAISQDAEGLSILWDRMLGAPRGLRGFAKTHVFQQAVIPSGGSINRMSAMVVSNGCQQWLSAMVFLPKTSIFEGFAQNGRHHAHRGVKPVRMVKFSGQTELISMISGTLLRRYTSVASGDFMSFSVRQGHMGVM